MRIPLLQRVHRATLAVVLLAPSVVLAQQSPTAHPWTEKSLPPARRANLLLAAMTPAEKFQQLVGAPGVVGEISSCYGARHVPGIARLGTPTFRITNGPVGVGQSDCVPTTTPNLPRAAMMSTASAKATALPSGMAVAASFDPGVAAQFGDVIGVETRNHGLHVLEGPGGH